MVDVFRYVKPRATSWPKADFIVGNPPFIGNKRMRKRLGAPYTQAVRGAYPEVPQEVDFVMYWWDRAARLVASGEVRRAGLITTKTIAQSNARPVLRTHMQSRQNPVSLVFAIANYPWHDTETTAAVRIAMTTIARGKLPGSLVGLVNERRVGRETTFDVVSETGFIQVDLSLGAEVASATPLKANAGLSWMGVKMSGEAFRIDRARRAEFIARGFPAQRLPLVVAGSDITDPPSDFYAVDCYGLSEDDLKSRYPSVYQYLSDYVRPARDQNDRDSYKDNWWQFAEPRPKLRASIADLRRFIGTSETSKHRIFRFIDRETCLIDGSVIAVASDDAYVLGVLASRFHRLWSDRAGGRMGAGNDPRYQNEMCFDPFPFPAAPDEALKDRVRAEAEALDVLHRDIVTAGLTITDAYNVLDALPEVNAGTRSLTDAERDTYERGLVSVVRQRLAEIDRLVAHAYGWNGELSNEEILTRLVALNRTRAAEEAEGLIRYLRPEIQMPGYTPPIAPKLPLAVAETQPTAQLFMWPGTLPEQIIAVAGVLWASPAPLLPADIAHAFKGKRGTTIVPILDALAAMGQAKKLPNGRYAA